MDKFFSRALGLAALMAGTGIFYHYVVYLPEMETGKRAAEAQISTTQEEKLKRQESKYQSCIISAKNAYKEYRAASCRRIALLNSKDLKNCLSTPILNDPYMGEQWCQKQYGNIDASPDCGLPEDLVKYATKNEVDAEAQCAIATRIGI